MRRKCEFLGDILFGSNYMVNKFRKKTRSYVMSRIRGKNRKPEIVVRSYLFSRELCFRKNDKRYPGSPGIMLPKYRTVVFVHGCFWHLHEGCKYAKMPESNVEYWRGSSTETGKVTNAIGKNWKIWEGLSSQ